MTKVFNQLQKEETASDRAAHWAIMQPLLTMEPIQMVKIGKPIIHHSFLLAYPLPHETSNEEQMPQDDGQNIQDRKHTVPYQQRDINHIRIRVRFDRVYAVFLWC